MLFQAIFIVGCGCDVKNPESALRSAYLVQPCWFSQKTEDSRVVACDENNCGIVLTF